MLRLRRSLKQYAYILDSVQIGLDLNSDFTIECDFITMDNTVTQDFVMKWGGQNQRSWNFSYPLCLGMQVSSDGTFNNSTGAYVSWTPSNGVLYHLATVFDMGTGSAKFFVNGIQFGNTQYNLKTSIYNSSEPVCIGIYNIAEGGFQTENLDGFISNVRVWNDKRTDVEILENCGKFIFGDEENLVSYWELNGDFLDKSPNQNNLTPVNSPSFVDFDFENQSYRKVVLNTNKEIGSSIFTDDCGHIITNSGNVKANNSQNVMDGISAYFDGSTSSLSIPSSTDFNLGSSDGGNFTVYFKVGLLGNQVQGFVCPYAYGTTNGWQIYYDGAGKISLWSGSGTTRSVTWNHSLNTQYCICVSRVGKIINIYSNGNLLGSVADGDFNNDGSKMTIGAINSSNGSSMYGWMKDLIILKGVAFIPTPNNYNIQFSPSVLSLNLNIKL